MQLKKQDNYSDTPRFLIVYNVNKIDYNKTDHNK